MNSGWLERAARWSATGFGLTVFAVYLGTLAPGLTGGDSGELISVAKELGVAHPPGYPLWTILSHVFSWLPFGSLAWRINVFSAVCGATAAGVLCRVIQLWTRQTWAGICGAGLFAFSPLVWEYSRQAEVFAFNHLLVAIVLWSATLYAQESSRRNVFLCALSCGLALAHHHTALFFVGPISVWVFVDLLARRPISGTPFLLATGGALLGLMPYLYLPIATHWSSGLAWGASDSWMGFWAHFLRREYGTFQLSSGTGAAPVTLGMILHHYFAAALKGLSGIGLPLAGWGMVALCCREKVAVRLGLRLAFGIGLAAYWFGFFALVNLPPNDPLLGGVLARFWMLSDLGLALLAGVGLALLTTIKRWPQWATPFFSVAVCVAALRWYGRELPPHNQIIAEYGRAILQPLPENALLLVRGDLPSNAIRYVQTAERFRADIVVLDLELLTREWYVRQLPRRFPKLEVPGQAYAPGVPGGFDFAGLVAANRPQRSIWLYPEPKPGDPSVAGFRFWPRGFAQEVRPNDDVPEIPLWAEANQRELEKLRDPFAAAITNAPGTWEQLVGADYASARHRDAFAWLQLAWGMPDRPEFMAPAQQRYEQFVAEFPDGFCYAWKNLGLIYSRQVERDPSVRIKLISAWRKYLELCPPSDPDRAAIESYLKQLDQGPSSTR